MIRRHAGIIATKARSLPPLRIVVLAAGFSRRLGTLKPLARVHGLTLLGRTLRVLATVSTATSIMVVTPPRANRMGVECRNWGAAWVTNRERGSGLSSSVRLGIAKAHYASAVMLLPVDLPHLTQRDLRRLLRRWRGARRRVVARRVADAAAVPLILPRWLYSRANALTGDHGLREVVRGLPAGWVSLLSLPSAAADIDTPQDLQRARRRMPTDGIRL